MLLPVTPVGQTMARMRRRGSSFVSKRPPDDADMKPSRGGAVSHAPRRLDLRGHAVLIVEDHADSLEMLMQIVGAFGATVVTARDGREAIEAVSRTAPDLVLCDLVMPNLNGFQFMDWLRGQPHLSRIPVIAVTALGSNADVVRTWSAGFNAHLVKPITYATLEAMLERFFWAGRAPGTQ